MKSYPTIPKDIVRNKDFYVFDKLDGSNIRGEWSKKRGFYKFGTRKRMLDASDLQFPDAPGLIIEKYEQDIADIMKAQRMDRAVFFFEYYGANSFAGYHHDEEKIVTLFDVNVYKKGILGPKDFVNLFGHLDIPSVLHIGKVGPEYERLVRHSLLEGMTYEGVVCKASNKKKPGLPMMFKVKSIAWLEALKVKCDGDEELFKKLA